MPFKNINEIMELAISRKKTKTVAIAGAEDEHTLEAVMKAKKDGFIEPLLVGNKKKILSILGELKGSIEEDRIFDSPDTSTSAYKAVQLAKQGAADILMKGKLNTSEILKAVLDKSDGLPHGKVVTHMALTELPGYHKILVLNDCAIIPYPTLEQKVAQINAVTETLHTMGYGDDIKIGVLCATEGLNPKIPESADAAKLKRMNQAGEIKGCIIEGPISLDIALVPEVARQKGFESPVAGDTDVLLMPSLVTGNVYAKAIEMAGAVPLGMVLGASVPIIVTSRVTTTMTKYYSLAIASTAVKEV